MSAPSRCKECHHKRGFRVSTKRKPACICSCHVPIPQRPVTIEEVRQALSMRGSVEFAPGEIYDSEDLYMFYDSNYEEHGEQDHAST